MSAVHVRDRLPVAWRLAGLLAGLLAGALALTPGAAVAQEAVEIGRAIAPDAAIKVWNGGGSLRVEGWSRDSLAVTGEVDPVAGGRFFLQAEGTVAKLGVEGDQAEVRGRLVVRVPAGATVWIRTSSADVTVRGLTGAVDIHTVAGDIDVDGRPATFYAESMAGDMRLHIKAGIARARAGTGRITFTGTVEDLALDAVSGGLDVTAPGLRRGRFTSVDGPIDFTGDVAPTGVLAFESHSGDVSVRLPADLEADFTASTFAGEIRIGYPEATAAPPGPGRRIVRFEIGAGGAEVEVRTYSGSLTVSPRDP